MDISVRTKGTILNENQSWIGKSSALEDADSITLDRALFNLVATFPNGFIPSGVVLGRVTASGLYGPYSDAAVDGRTVAVGFLLASVPYDRDSTANIVAALMWHGEIVEANLPLNHGLDAAARTDLAAKFRFV